MQLDISASRAASIALLSLLFALHVHAQSSTVNVNVTLRFFQDSQQDSCNYSTSDRALTFTTSSVPILTHCFNLVDLFIGNATKGFVNQTLNQDPRLSGEAGIHWALLNTETFDPQANYSRVLYHQIVGHSLENGKASSYADRAVTLYPGRDCTEGDPNDNSTQGLLPWYGFSCRSGDSGSDASCGMLPYALASFTIQPGRDDDEEQNRKCWVFAERGAAGRSYAGARAVMGGFVSVALAIWLVL